MPSRDKNLEPIKDRRIAERYLKYLLDLNESVSCYIEELDLRFETSAKAFRAEKSELVLEIDPRSADALEDSDFVKLDNFDYTLRLSFQVGDVLYFAAGHRLKRIYHTITAKIEHPIFKLQRRNALRIKVLDEHEAQANLGGNIFEIHDISASGMSMVVPSPRGDDFPKGKRFPKAALRFAGLNMRVDMEVVSTAKLRKADHSDLKIGLKFHGLPPSAEQSIAKEAYLHTHKIWSRWI